MPTDAEARECGQPGVLRVFRTRDQVRSYYDRIARFYDLLAERSEGPVRRAGLRMLDVCAGETALEIGVGTGHCLAALARAVGPRGRVFGVDLSPGMLKLARKRLRREGLNERVELVLGDAVGLPWADRTVDAAFMSFTLELFDTPEIARVLAELRRVLRPGGRLVVVSLTRLHPDNLMCRVYEWTHQRFPDIQPCRPILVQRAIEDAGFTVQRVKHRRMWGWVEVVLGTKD